jgi:hypothetical protein
VNVYFDSAPFFDERSGGVKFAGRLLANERERHIVCKVTRDFLLRYFNFTNPTPDQLVEAYLARRKQINKVAEGQITRGDRRPVIDVSEVV